MTGESESLKPEELNDLEAWVHVVLRPESPQAEQFRRLFAQARRSTPPVIGSDESLRPHGWLFFCPDEGEQWSKNHPVESGENPYAENIRPGTPPKGPHPRTGYERVSLTDAGRAALSKTETP